MLVYQRVIWPILYETSGWLLKLLNPQSHLRGQCVQCVNGLMFPYPPVSSWRSLGNLWTFYAAFDWKIIEVNSDFWGYSMVDDTFFSSFLGGYGSTDIGESLHPSWIMSPQRVSWGRPCNSPVITRSVPTWTSHESDPWLTIHTMWPPPQL